METVSVSHLVRFFSFLTLETVPGLPLWCSSEPLQRTSKKDRLHLYKDVEFLLFWVASAHFEELRHFLERRPSSNRLFSSTVKIFHSICSFSKLKIQNRFSSIFEMTYCASLLCVLLTFKAVCCSFCGINVRAVSSGLSYVFLHKHIQINPCHIQPELCAHISAVNIFIVRDLRRNQNFME